MNLIHDCPQLARLTKMAVIDTRPWEAYQQGHVVGSLHLPFAQFNEWQMILPPRQTEVVVIGELSEANEIQQWLSAHGYLVKAYLNSETLLQRLKHCEKAAKSLKNYKKRSESPVLFAGLNDIWVSGTEKGRLWRPNSLLQAFVAEKGTAFFRGKSVLDLGCGSGREAIYLASIGAEVTAIDHKEQVLQRAKQLASFEQVSLNFETVEALVFVQACLAQGKTFEVVMGFRFLERRLFDTIGDLLAEQGWLLWQTFSTGCEAFGSPKNPRFILQSGELAEKFNHFEIFTDKIETIEDGRPVASFIAQKRKAVI